MELEKQLKDLNKTMKNIEKLLEKMLK